MHLNSIYCLLIKMKYCWSNPFDTFESIPVWLISFFIYLAFFSILNSLLFLLTSFFRYIFLSFFPCVTKRQYRMKWKHLKEWCKKKRTQKSQEIFSRSLFDFSEILAKMWISIVWIKRRRTFSGSSFSYLFFFSPYYSHLKTESNRDETIRLDNTKVMSGSHTHTDQISYHVSSLNIKYYLFIWQTNKIKLHVWKIPAKLYLIKSMIISIITRIHRNYIHFIYYLIF